MCLIISNEENYSFLEIRNIADKDSHFTMLGMKEFRINETKLYGAIIDHQYCFVQNRYGIRVVNDDTNQVVHLNYNTYFNNGINDNITTEKTYIRRKMGYHVSAFQIPDKRYECKFYELNRIYIVNYSNNLIIPVMFFHKDIQMISGNEAVIRNFTILEPDILEKVLIDNNLDKLLIWEGNEHFMEVYRDMYEKLINGRKQTL